MLFSQNLISLNNVNSYNTSVQQINRSQKAVEGRVEAMISATELKLQQAQNAANNVQDRLNEIDRQLYILEALL